MDRHRNGVANRNRVRVCWTEMFRKDEKYANKMQMKMVTASNCI